MDGWIAAHETRTWRFWVYLGDPEQPFTVFTYTPSRSRDGPQEFLKNWSGYLQADAFGGYDGLYAGQAGGHVTEVACWAHARRKFYEARTSDVAVSTQALAYIRLLYDVEDAAKEQFAQQDPAAHRPLSAFRLALRQELAVPRLQQFHAWLQSQQAQHGGPVLPKSPLGEALTYTFNQWARDGVHPRRRLAIDNTLSETALRRVARPQE